MVEQLLPANVKLTSEKDLPKQIIKGNHFMLETQLQRQKVLRRFCKKYQVPYENLEYNRNFLYSDAKKFIYCRIPKVACKTWKKILGYVQGRFDSPYNVSLFELYSFKYPYLATLINKGDSDGVEERKDGYFSFMFSRHPFDRLFSAYRNKIQSPLEGLENYLLKLGPRIMTLNGKDPATHAKKMINGTDYLDVSFEEFVTYVLKARLLDPHWDHQVKICHLCNYPFAYLGKFETMATDANKLFDMLDIQIDKLPEDGQYNTESHQFMKDHYAKLPKALIEEVYEFYKDDFLAFGYDKNEYFTM
ncbi:carbohydrate sulfotransferase 9-like [Clytia hemisphaerica]|uniref:Carbohydrate sulfotransferase n=1 Tax=Clytia hemisphaerica TaxID=252671 RepID=A0A7M5XD17_9CNID|eukprot:TCONS_00008596-protein